MRHARRYRAFAGAKILLLITGVFFVGFGRAQNGAPNDPIKMLVGRLDLQSYKATIKALR